MCTNQTFKVFFLKRTKCAPGLFLTQITSQDFHLGTSGLDPPFLASFFFHLRTHHPFHKCNQPAPGLPFRNVWSVPPSPTPSLSLCPCPLSSPVLPGRAGLSQEESKVIRVRILKTKNNIIMVAAPALFLSPPCGLARFFSTCIPKSGRKNK